jgi:glutamyl-tRNA reductase
MHLISQEVNKFNNWLGTLDAVPTIVEIRKRVENIGNQEMERTLKKIPHLSEEDKKIIYQMKNSMINKILHKPTIKLKQKTQSEDGHIYLKAIRHLFHLDD